MSVMGILIREHQETCLTLKKEHGDEVEKHYLTADVFQQIDPANVRLFKKERGKNIYPYKIDAVGETIRVRANYYIGIDWLVPSERYLYVEPKVNSAISDCFEKQVHFDESDDAAIEKLEDQTKNKISESASKRLNYLQMLLNVMVDSDLSKHCSNLVLIDWEAQRISIEQENDHLTPFLIIQFLQLTRQIVRKGLKKSYYKVEENLDNRIKGKILVGQHIKQNVFKNRLTQTYCQYQVFGIDNLENRFLKMVLRFVSSYIDNHHALFEESNFLIKQLMGYIRPAFESVRESTDEDIRHLKHNPFFKEYKEAIQIGQYILQRFAYHISNTSKEQRETPPFWIDMPRLFELYVYKKLLEANPCDTAKIKYQFSTYGNALDILVKDGHQSIIIDAKYKIHYKNSHIHQDIRQVAGYARLRKVREALGLKDEQDQHINCLIIYPDMEKGLDLEKVKELDDIFSLDAIRKCMNSDNNKIQAYHKVYKIGVKIPAL